MVKFQKLQQRHCSISDNADLEQTVLLGKTLLKLLCFMLPDLFWKLLLQNVICLFVSLRTVFLKDPLFAILLAPVVALRYLKCSLQLWKAENQHAFGTLWRASSQGCGWKVPRESAWKMCWSNLRSTQVGQASPEPHARFLQETRWVKISWGTSVRDAKVEDCSQNLAREAPPGSRRWTTLNICATGLTRSAERKGKKESQISFIPGTKETKF